MGQGGRWRRKQKMRLWGRRSGRKGSVHNRKKKRREKGGEGKEEIRKGGREKMMEDEKRMKRGRNKLYRW